MIMGRVPHWFGVGQAHPPDALEIVRISRFAVARDRQATLTCKPHRGPADPRQLATPALGINRARDDFRRDALARLDSTEHLENRRLYGSTANRRASGSHAR